MNNVVKTLLMLSAPGTIITIIILLLNPLIQNTLSQKWRYYIWLIVIFRLLVPLGLPINIAISSGSEGFAAASKQPDPQQTQNDLFDNSAKGSLVDDFESGYYIAPQNVPGNIAPKINTNDRSNAESLLEYLSENGSTYITIIWITAGILLFTKRIIGYRRFIRYVKASSTAIDDDYILDTCHDACQMLGIKHELPVYSTKAIGSPMLIGLIKPRIILPESQTCNDPHLKYIFLHELMHYRRFDILYKWLVQIALCMHWFNPLVYTVSRQINKLCELSCDEAVIKVLDAKEQRAYGDTLLYSFERMGAHTNQSLSLALTESSALLKERLKAIMKYRKKTKITGTISIVLALILCTGAAFTRVHAQTVNKDEVKAQSNPDAAKTDGVVDTETKQNTVVPIDIKALKAGETKTYGPYFLNKGEVWSADIENWEGTGRILIADMRDDKSFKQCLIVESAPDSFAILCDESRYYSIIITGDRDTDLANIKGKLTLNRTGSQSGDRERIEVDLPLIEKEKYKSYGPYNLKVGDTLTAKLTWANDSGVYFAIGNNENIKNYKGFYSRYGKQLNETIKVWEEGSYYIFVGSNKSTGNLLDVQDLYGTITIDRNNAVQTIYESIPSSVSQKLTVDISSVSAGIYVKNYGMRSLTKKDTVYADISWNGSGNVMLLFTEDKYNTEEITSLIDRGILPLGGGGKFAGAGSEITSNFRYQTSVDMKTLNFTTSGKEIYTTMNVNSEGDYYFYVIARGTEEIKDIQGSISFTKKTETNSSVGDSKLASDSYTYEGVVAATKFQYGNPFPAKSGDIVTISLTDELSGGQLDKAKMTIKVIIGGNDGTTQEVVLSNMEPEKTITIKENANHHISIHNPNNEIVNYSFALTIKSTEDKGEDKLPRMNAWSGSTGEVETATGIQIRSLNYTGDKISYSFETRKNASRTLQLNSSLTGKYEIYFIASDRTILKAVPSFTGAKEITLTELPEGTISMIVYSNGVSGSLTVTDTAKSEGNNIIDLRSKGNNISESGSFQVKSGQSLVLIVESDIKGGTADLFLFDPSGKEQRIAIGSSGFTKEINLTDGIWQYNCSGIFKDGGTLRITGKIL